MDNRLIFIQWLNCVKPDIVCLQETHSISIDEFKNWFNSTSYKCISSPGTARSCGVGILISRNFDILQQWRDQNGRYVVAELSRQNFTFRIHCLYGPNENSTRENFFGSICPTVDPILPNFFLGDFNTVINPVLDRFGCNLASPWAPTCSQCLESLMSATDSVDIWRYRNPSSEAYTWHRPNGQQGSRLDMIWLPERYVGFVNSCEILPYLRSDHRYVYLTINLPFNTSYQRSYWKLNVSLLSKPVLRQRITDFWHDWQRKKLSFQNLSVWWDAGKLYLRQIIQKFSREIAFTNKQKFSNLNSLLNELTRRRDKGDASVDPDIETTKLAIDSIMLNKAKGAQIRARLQWAEDGEKPSKFFLSMERKRAQQKLISGVYRPDGSIATDIGDVILNFSNFYKTLFTSQPLDETKTNYFLSNLERKLTDLDSESCEGPLFEGECLAALRGMPKNKTPGIDGLPCEFYLSFWDLIGSDFVAVSNFCFDTGSLSPTQRQGVISLLYKKGDELEARNWRPISLLCVDYKIMARSLAKRLLNVIGSVVSPDQTCGIPGRSASENIALIRDVVNFSAENDKSVAVISFDQEKAFDRVEWSFLHQVLTTMGFGPSFCGWVKLLYTNVRSAVQVNGFLSGFFSVGRGVRQGCPLSPLLYVLVAETLACTIRADPIIVGLHLPVGNTELRVSQYADDTTAIVSTDHSIRRIFDLFLEYELASGAKLNNSKCHGLWLGSWANRSESIVPIQWSSDSISILGSTLGPAITLEKIWAPVVRKIESTLSSWANQSLSFSGKSTVINTLVVSRIWYLASVFCIPDSIISSMNRAIFSFFWSGKMHLVNQATLQQPVLNGGFGVCNIRLKMLALHAQWVRRFVTPTAGKWSSFFHHYLRKVFLAEPVLRVFGFSQHSNRTLRKLPSFYASVLYAWQQLSGFRDSNGNLLAQLLPNSPPTPVHLLSAKAAYQSLMVSCFVPPVCEERFRNLNVSSWSLVWLMIHKCKFIRPILDTAWKIAHGVIPTADRLIHFQMNVSPHCFCQELESLEHLFHSCTTTSQVLMWYSNLLSSHLHNAPLVSIKHVLVGFERALAVPAGFQVLLHIVKHHIWIHRNSIRFDSSHPDPILMLNRIKSTFKFALRVQFRHTPISQFTAAWLASGIFGYVSPDGELQFAACLQNI